MRKIKSVALCLASLACGWVLGAVAGATAVLVAAALLGAMGVASHIGFHGLMCLGLVGWIGYWRRLIHLIHGIDEPPRSEKPRVATRLLLWGLGLGYCWAWAHLVLYGFDS